MKYKINQNVYFKGRKYARGETLELTPEVASSLKEIAIPQPDPVVKKPIVTPVVKPKAVIPVKKPVEVTPPPVKKAVPEKKAVEKSSNKMVKKAKRKEA